MAKAKKLPSGAWRTLVYDYTDESGKRHYESFTADSKKESEYMAAEYSLNKNKKKRPKDLTIQEAVKKYIESKQNVLSPATERGYWSIYRNNLKSIEHVSLRDITNEQIQVWVNQISINLSPKTVRNAHGLLSATLDMFSPDFKISTTLPAKRKPELYVPSDKDIKLLLSQIEGTELELAVLLAAFGPLRRGEICALSSDDIDGNFVTVRKSMVRKPDQSWEIKIPKTYSSYRTIEFPEFVIKKIPKTDGRIFDCTPDSITYYFTKAIKQSDLTVFRFHDLRHYAASIMHAIGIPDQYIMQRGGWSSDNTLKSVYRNAIDENTKKFTGKIINHFDEITNN